MLLCRTIPNIFQCYMRAPSDSEAKPIGQLYRGTGVHLAALFFYFNLALQCKVGDTDSRPSYGCYVVETLLT